MVTTTIGTSFITVVLKIDRHPRRSSESYAKKKSSFPKVPTVISYHKRDSKIVKWGLSAVNMNEEEKREYGELIELFKLHFDEEFLNTPPESIPVLPEGKTALTVISDYLRELYGCICSEIKTLLGENDFEDKKAFFQYCITIPSNWSTDAKIMMEDAVILAGIVKRDNYLNRLVIITDMEAAIVNAEMATPEMGNFESGDKVLICDVGGATVNIAVFKKIVEGTKKIFVEMTERSVYYACISDLLDDRMKRLLKQLVQPFNYDKERLRLLDEVLDSFIKDVKVSTTSSDVRMILVNLSS
jgi:hypothetical protein